MLVSKSKIRKVRFWWNFTFAFFQKYKVRVAAIIAASILLILISPKILNVFFQTNEISIGYVGNNTLESIPADVLKLVTGSLITTDSSGKPQPSLASQWTVSNDGRTYVVFIKDNLFWHDGTPVVAKDISIAINGVQIIALNDKALQFTLPNRVPSFLMALNKPVFKANSFYGTGPYRIVQIDKISGIVKRMSLYPKDSTLPKIIIKFYPNDTQAINALKNGEIQNLTVANSEEFTSWPNLDVTKTIDDSQTVTIFLNNAQESLSSKEVRQALSYAINRSNFDGELAYSPISKSSWAYSENVRRYEYNTAKAKELLSKGTNQKTKISLSYTPEFAQIAQSIKNDWEAIGIIVNLKLERKVPQDFDALLTIDSLPHDPDQYALWHSTQTETNITHYKNVKIDKLLEDGRSTEDQSERASYYSDFQKFLTDDEPAIFLYYPNKYTITYKNTEGKLALIKKLD